ncbi:MAG: hypothetical protein LBT99_00055 [Bifidobacteriaceae bacterium]|jgi:Amt family ammonium transporter|nr:hypothetical protein [Bifidobacteriaceae bacterium]
MNTLNVSWLLISICLAFLSTFGTILFYVSSRENYKMHKMISLCLISIATASIIWVLWGWSLASGPSDIFGIISNPFEEFLLNGKVFSNDIIYTSVPASFQTVGGVLGITFQMVLLMLAIVIIACCLGGRQKFSSWILFCILWITLVFCPISHIINTGFLSNGGAIIHLLGTSFYDFAGASKVQLTSVTTVAVILVLLRRKEIDETIDGSNQNQVAEPSSKDQLCALVSIFALMIGYFGIIMGATLNADSNAGYGLIITILIACSSMVGWISIQQFLIKKFSIFSIAHGVLCGLILSTACAGVVSPTQALFLGLLSGIICNIIVRTVRKKISHTVGWDVVSIHFPACVIGLLAVGFLEPEKGLLVGGSFNQFLAQILGISFVIIYVSVFSALISLFVNFILGWHERWIHRENETQKLVS